MSRELTDAFAERKHQQVMADTWGHLAPAAGVRQGYIVFAHGAYGDIVPIDCEFDGVDDSPWFFAEMMEFIDQQDTESGEIYRFRGTYEKLRNGDYRFTGNTGKVGIT